MEKRIIPISREFGRKRALRHRGALRRFYLSCKSSYPHFTAVLPVDVPRLHQPRANQSPTGALVPVLRTVALSSPLIRCRVFSKGLLQKKRDSLFGKLSLKCG